MAQLDSVSGAILVSIGLIVGIGIALMAIRRYEIAVLVVAISSVVSLLSPSNEPPLALDEFQTGGTSYARAAALALMGMVGIVKFLQPRAEGRRREGIDFMLLAMFILLAFASSVYSIERSITMSRSLSFAALFCFLLGLYRWLEGERFAALLEILFWFVIGCTLVNLLSFLVPDLSWFYAAPDRFKGLFDEPNSMGAFCMISYPICLWKYSRTPGRLRWVAAGTIVALAAMHVLTGSRSSMIASAVGMLVWFMVAHGRLTSVVSLAALAGVALAVVQLNPSGFARESAGGATDLTGRPELWSAAYVLVMEKPVLGYGYDVEGSVFSDPRFYDPTIGLWGGTARVPMHNGYLSVAVGLGIVGLVLWTVVLLVPFGRSLLLPESPYKAFVVSTMAMCLITNFVESVITGGRSVVGIAYWISWVMAERLATDAKTEHSLVEQPVAEAQYRNSLRVEANQPLQR
jgi:exopolysaccharide production protein ExoQ